MKSFCKRYPRVLIPILLLLALSACTNAKEDTVNIQPLAFSSLQMEENQSFDIVDYDENNLLLLIFDTEKIDPKEPEGMQAPAKFCDKFVLYDISKQSVTKEFPVGQFGNWISAVAAFDGVLLTWVQPDPDQAGETSSAICYVNETGMEAVYPLAITKFAPGPRLFRMDDAIVFDYANALTDREFGVKKMTSDFQVETLLRFSPGQEEQGYGEFAVSDSHYVYTVDEGDQVTFYVGGAEQDITTFGLPKEETIHSVGLSANWILVCKREPVTEGGAYSIERFDLSGNAVERYPLQKKLLSLTGTNDDAFCGFNAATPVELFDINNGIAPIALDSAAIDGTFHGALSNGESFVIKSYQDIREPRAWLITLPDKAAENE